MSRKERDRLAIMRGVKCKELTLVQAAGLMGVSYRHSKRLWRRYRAEGDAGLVHRLRGKSSARRKPPALKAQVLAICQQERYAGFGPTLLAEYLQKQGMSVDHETLRRWLVAAGQRTLRRRRQKHRQWRERKPCFGAMVQLDGSHHDWFEGRRAACVLMVMVDDATNRVGARFHEEETTRASYDVFEDWTRRYRVPRSLYVDRDSIYRCEGLPSVAEQLAGKAPQTQFGRAMEQLGVDLILAQSPQAKGRVERMNGVLQDRLVKALRLAGIRDLEAANRFLEQEFLPAFNRQFNVPAASALDVHQAVPRHLEEVLSWEEARVVQRDWTVACEGRWYQLDRQHESMSLVGRRVIVRRLRDGRVQLLYRGQKLKWRALPERPQRIKPPVRKTKTVNTVPVADHPWRRLGAAVGRKFWREVKARGQAQQQTPRLGVRDCARPSLRSASLRPAPPTGAKRAAADKL